MYVFVVDLYGSVPCWPYQYSLLKFSLHIPFLPFPTLSASRHCARSNIRRAAASACHAATGCGVARISELLPELEDLRVHAS